MSAIEYRHEVMRDLENGPALECIKAFAGQILLMRQKMTLADKSYYKQQRERWFLSAVETYCRAVRDLHRGLSQLQLSSRGLMAFLDYLAGHVASDGFAGLTAAADKLTTDLAAIEYCVLIKAAASRFASIAMRRTTAKRSPTSSASSDKER